MDFNHAQRTHSDPIDDTLCAFLCTFILRCVKQLESTISTMLRSVCRSHKFYGYLSEYMNAYELT